MAFFSASHCVLFPDGTSHDKWSLQTTRAPQIQIGGPDYRPASCEAAMEPLTCHSRVVLVTQNICRQRVSLHHCNIKTQHDRSSRVNPLFRVKSTLPDFNFQTRALCCAKNPAGRSIIYYRPMEQQEHF